MKRVLCLLALMFSPLISQAAPTVSVSANPSTGVYPYTSTVTWTVTGAVSCTATDGWTGAKTTTGGTQQVTVSAATKYTLTCAAADGQTTTSWTPPTTLSDDTPLTDLAGFNIYRGTTTTNLTRVKSVGPTVLSYVDTGLATGQYYYQVSAVRVASSAESTQAKATPFPVSVTGSSATASASAGPVVVPNPPGNVTTVVTNATAYEVRPTSTGGLVANRIGLIPLGSICSPETRTVNGVTYNRVDPKSVDLFNVPAVIPPVEVFARCMPAG
jgi:hypothetical protein